MYDNIRQYTPKGSFLCDYSLLAARVAVSNLHKMTIAVPLGHVHGWLLGVGGGGRLRRAGVVEHRASCKWMRRHLV